MVIKALRLFALENMQAALDKMFKDTGHPKNAYFSFVHSKKFF